MITITKVAQLCGVDRDTVKTWTKEFSEHFSLTANPPSGSKRQFNEADLRVCALLSEYWEDEPDLENIHAMLNSGDYLNERYLEFGRTHTNVFQDVPDEIDETWQHGTLIGGMAMRDLPHVAKAYKAAADELLALALSKYEPHELDYPIMFLYRHSLELYLKALLHTPPGNHDLLALVGLLEKQFGSNVAPWIANRIRDFHAIDQMSAMFRYADGPSSSELWVDFHQLKHVMDKLVAAFEEQLKSAISKSAVQRTY